MAGCFSISIFLFFFIILFSGNFLLAIILTTLFITFNLAAIAAASRYQRQVLMDQSMAQGNRTTMALESFNVIPSIVVQDGNTGRSAVVTSGVSLSNNPNTQFNHVRNLPQAEANTFFNNGVQNEEREAEEKEKQSREAEELYGTAVYFASPEDVSKEKEKEEKKEEGTDPTKQP
ncbi:hypothetical protein AGDE_16654 [Angomonas deanei]|nr:hypothetical protein AGDE_16654 [Angomonas deanei]|eukprot:EPY16688.1 hypothetical protein AGDE_16654 [Angomonas deanei]